jgi:hypothetical protein
MLPHVGVLEQLGVGAMAGGLVCVAPDGIADDEPFPGAIARLPEQHAAVLGRIFGVQRQQSGAVAIEIVQHAGGRGQVRIQPAAQGQRGGLGGHAVEVDVGAAPLDGVGHGQQHIVHPGAQAFQSRIVHGRPPTMPRA